MSTAKTEVTLTATAMLSTETGFSGLPPEAFSILWRAWLSI